MRLRQHIIGARWGLAVLGAFALTGTATAETKGTTKIASTALDVRIAPNLLRATGSRQNLKRHVQLSVGEGASANPKFTTNLPVGPRGATLPVETVQIDGGRVDAFLPPEVLPRGVLLQAPDKILGISTGGHMAVIVEEKRIIVAAISGDVLVGQDSKFKPLDKNKMRIFSRASGASRDVEIPAATTLSSDAGLSVALTGAVKVALKSSSELVTRVVVTDALGMPISAPRDIAAGAPIEVSVPRAGLYYAVARPIGEGGIAGPLTAPLRIQVLGLAAGQAPAQNGVFLLNAGERVRLAGTDGLEVRYGSSPIYVPATSSIGLSQPRETLVEFRNPQSPDQRALLKLAPRYMKKEIELGPSGARWPGNPVQLRVGLWDGAGKLLHDKKDMDVQVTVNSGKVPVRWRATDSGLVTSVPKQKGDGPWVIRVNVQDKKGRTIARDFLEVAAR